MSVLIVVLQDQEKDEIHSPDPNDSAVGRISVGRGVNAVIISSPSNIQVEKSLLFKQMRAT